MLELLSCIKYIPDNGGYFIWLIGHRNGSRAGTITTNCYDVITFKGCRFYSHRLLWFITYGELPFMIDHIDGNRAHNIISNLRQSNHESNGRNRKEHREGQAVGVSFRKDTGKWISQYWKDKKKVYLGQFDSMSDAFNALPEEQKGIRCNSL